MFLDSRVTSLDVASPSELVIKFLYCSDPWSVPRNSWSVASQDRCELGFEARRDSPFYAASNFIRFRSSLTAMLNIRPMIAMPIKIN